MNIAIVDDVAADRLRLERTLREYNSIHSLDMAFCHFANGETLLKDYQPFRYAVIFIDIFMDGISGIETAEAIRKVDDDAVLVFLTTSEAHRPEAFSLFATAYLAKTYSDEQVYRTLDHIFRVRTDAESHFLFAFDRKDYSLRCADIVSLEKDSNYLIVVDRNGRTYRTRMTFYAAENQVDSRFLVLMKGLIVNMDYIVQVKDNVCLMQGGAVFPLHVKRAKELRQRWLNYKFALIREGTPGFGGND